MQNLAPLSVAQEMLPASSRNRGLAMDRTSADAGPNMFDNGPSSEPFSNAQPYNNQLRQMQGIRENTKTAMNQAGAAAVQDNRLNNQRISQQQENANQFARERVFQLLDASDGGRDLMQFGALMQSPEGQSARNNIAMGQAELMGANYDLAAEAANSSMYG